MASTGSGVPRPTAVKTSDLKSRILNVAQTSVYLVRIQPPPAVTGYLNSLGFNYASRGGDVELACESTRLPGQRLTTVDVNNDYRGVSEKMAYRKSFDDTTSFTFYVNKQYDVVQMFEGWIDYIAGVNRGGDYLSPYASYRMNYPDSYRSNAMYITKFEKDAGHEIQSGNPTAEDDQKFSLEYSFVGAYPLSISETNVSYGPSDVLKYTVNMTYIRYVMSRNGRGQRGSGGFTGSTGSRPTPASATLGADAFDTQNGRFLGPPTADPFLGNSQAELNQLYADARAGKIKRP